MPSNTGRLSTKLDGFWITKNPSPLIAMKVPIDDDWMSPCTVLVARELATTLPANCLDGMSSGIRSTKLVSIRLKAVVCELAMLPETFSSANACARIPVTAVVRAPKIPMTSSPTAFRAAVRNARDRLRPLRRSRRRKPRAKEILRDFNGLGGPAEVRPSADLPRRQQLPCRGRTRAQSGRRVRRELQGDAVDAVAQPRGLRSVVEHVAEMAAAAPAMNLRARDQEGIVGRGADRIG